MIYFCTEHSKEDIDRYFESLKKAFKLISDCENGRDVNTLLETPVCHSTFERLN